MLNKPFIKKALGAIAIALLCATAIHQMKAHTKGIVDDE
jgi:hypothetical protein